MNERTPGMPWPRRPSPWFRSDPDQCRAQRRWDWHPAACWEGGLSSSLPTQRAGWVAALHLSLKAETTIQTKENFCDDDKGDELQVLQKTKVLSSLKYKFRINTKPRLHMHTHMQMYVCMYFETNVSMLKSLTYLVRKRKFAPLLIQTAALMKEQIVMVEAVWTSGTTHKYCTHALLLFLTCSFSIISKSSVSWFRMTGEQEGVTHAKDEKH